MRAVFVAMTIAVGAMLTTSCGSKPPAEPAEKAHKENGKGEEGHPQNYIEEANVVELSQEGQQRAGIAVAPLAASAVEARAVLTGTIQPVDSHVTQVRPLARGRITQVLVKIGDRVQKDQSLAQYDNIEAGELAAQYASAQAEVERLKIQSANAQRQAERSRKLADIGASPAKDAENSEAEARAVTQAIRAQESAAAGLRARLQRFGSSVTGGDSSLTSIRAPFAGVVTRLDTAPGAVADSTTPLLTIADLSTVLMEAQVFERDLGRVHIGQPTQVKVEAYPNEVFHGKIVAIRDILDPQTRTATARIELPNPQGKLRLEMFATVELPTLGTHSALTIPTEAVQTINQRQVVFIKQDSLHFAAREVKVAGDGLMREVVSGVKEGETVVVKGAYQLKSVFLSRQVQGEHEH